jgi:hypothetical protein
MVDRKKMGEHKLNKTVFENLETVDIYTHIYDFKNEISKYIKIAIKTYKSV